MYLTEIAEKAIADIQEKFRVEVTGCVTDNAANMEGIRRALALKFPKMQNIGCCAHWLNLLMKDIAKDQTAVLERVIEVLRWFRNNHQAAACLRQRELALPPLPSTTRWNSHAESLAYFNKHWAALNEIAASILKPGTPARSTLEMLQVRRATEDLLEQVICIAQGLNRAQENNSTIVVCTIVGWGSTLNWRIVPCASWQLLTPRLVWNATFRG